MSKREITDPQVVAMMPQYLSDDRVQEIGRYYSGLTKGRGAAKAMTADEMNHRVRTIMENPEIKSFRDRLAIAKVVAKNIDVAGEYRICPECFTNLSPAGCCVGERCSKKHTQVLIDIVYTRNARP